MLDYEGYEEEFLKEGLQEIDEDANQVYDTIMDLSSKLNKMVIKEYTNNDMQKKTK